MSKAFIGDHFVADITEGHAAEVVLDNQEGVGSVPRSAGEGAETFSCAALVQPRSASTPQQADQPAMRAVEPQARTRRTRKKPKHQLPVAPLRQRFGLPEGFVPRLQRFERSILIELNVYRLPNDQEFIPGHPSGTLGAQRHLYALLTTEQYLTNKRGSVYIRNDGRIFDYSVDVGVPGGDLFDTGYTIYDLERTGRYAPSRDFTKEKNEPARIQRAANAG